MSAAAKFLSLSLQAAHCPGQPHGQGRYLSSAFLYPNEHEPPGAEVTEVMTNLHRYLCFILLLLLLLLNLLLLLLLVPAFFCCLWSVILSSTCIFLFTFLELCIFLVSIILFVHSLDIGRSLCNLAVSLSSYQLVEIWSLQHQQHGMTRAGCYHITLQSETIRD